VSILAYHTTDDLKALWYQLRRLPVCGTVWCAETWCRIDSV